MLIEKHVSLGTHGAIRLSYDIETHRAVLQVMDDSDRTIGGSFVHSAVSVYSLVPIYDPSLHFISGKEGDSRFRNQKFDRFDQRDSLEEHLRDLIPSLTRLQYLNVLQQLFR